MTEPADLSDAELCGAVAKEVMGWSQMAANFNQRVSGWGLNWSGIGQVVEAMADKGHEVVMSVSTAFENIPGWDKYVCTVWQVDNDDNAVKVTSNDSMARAVFEAALKAVRSVET